MKVRGNIKGHHLVMQWSKMTQTKGKDKWRSNANKWAHKSTESAAKTTIAKIRRTIHRELLLPTEMDEQVCLYESKARGEHRWKASPEVTWWDRAQSLIQGD